MERRAQSRSELTKRRRFCQRESKFDSSNCGSYREPGGWVGFAQVSDLAENADNNFLGTALRMGMLTHKDVALSFLPETFSPACPSLPRSF